MKPNFILSKKAKIALVYLKEKLTNLNSEENDNENEQCRQIKRFFGCYWWCDNDSDLLFLLYWYTQNIFKNEHKIEYRILLLLYSYEKFSTGYNNKILYLNKKVT